jgi:hypothetical protein
MDMANATASLPQQYRAAALRLTQGKRLPPEVRVGLIETMRQSVGGMRQVYDQQRDRYSALAQQNGFDPTQIIGEPLYKAYTPAEEQYITAHGGTPRVNGVPVDGVNVATAPTEKGFDKSPDPTLANLSPAQAKAYDAWWGAHPDPTPDQLRAFGTSLGINIGNADEIIAAKKQTGSVSHDLQYKPDISDARGGGGIGEAIDATVRGAADTMTFGLADKLAAVAGAATDPNSTLGQNLARQYSISDYDTENHFPARTAGQLGGAIALPMGEMSSIPQVAAKSGAFGAAYGAGSSRSLSDVAGNALLGGVGGATIGGGLAGAGQGIKSLAVRGGRAIAGKTSPEQQALLRAGDQENVPLNMGDVYPNLRNTIATQETIPLSAGPIRKGIQEGRDAIEKRVADLGQGGVARGEGALGERIYKAGERFIGEHQATSAKDYGNARTLGGGVTATPERAMAATQAVISKLSETENTNRSTLGIYRDVMKDFLDQSGNLKPLSVEGIRSLRRNIRKEMANRGLMGSKEDADLQSIVDAASEDMYAALNAHNPKAAEAFKRADQGYSQRMGYIRNTLQSFMGTRDKPVSGEALTAKIKAMAGSGARGNARQLNDFMRMLSPEERSDVAASLAANLGRKSAEEPFSPGTFLSNIRNIDERSRIVLFGPKGAKSIQNLIKLSTAKQESVARLNNSRSGQVTNYRAVLSNLLVGLPGGGALLGAGAAFNGATGAAGGAAIGGGILAGSRAMAKALMNEDFTRMVAQAPATMNPKAIDAHFGRLKQIAAKDPNVRAVVEAIERKIMSGANDNAMSSAAASDTNTEEK